MTSCIAYNASAKDLENELNTLNNVMLTGGVEVRRYGVGDITSDFGYSYRLDFNALGTNYLSTRGSVQLSVGCLGLECGCAETLVPMIDSSGQYSCPRGVNSSYTNPAACVSPPSIEISRLVTLGSLKTSGKGSIVVEAGTHWVPPILDSVFVVQGGVAIVCADVVNWSDLILEQTGKVIVSGLKWIGWDLAVKMFDSKSILDLAELAAALPNSQPEAVSMQVLNISISDNGALLVAAPGSNVTIFNGDWSGGVIGGVALISIGSQLNCFLGHKIIAYGAIMRVLRGATLFWSGGDIRLHDGSSLQVYGTFQMSSYNHNHTHNSTQFLGNATSQDLSYSFVLSEARRIWYGRYSPSPPLALQDIWFMNPLCAPNCSTGVQILVGAGGSILGTDNSSVTFLSELFLLPGSRLTVSTDGRVNLAAGGKCSSQSTIFLLDKSYLELSGGQFNMDPSCILGGVEGTLMVSGGNHETASVLHANVVLEGGSLIWPLSREAGSSLTFGLSLRMAQDSSIKVEPLSTNIVVQGTATIGDNSVIQFPEVGTAEVPGPYDKIDAPDASPRGNITFSNILYWNGGTFLGKADFYCHQLYLAGGEKRIRSLAKLINLGHAGFVVNIYTKLHFLITYFTTVFLEWSFGDILMGDFGDFVNLGSVQMSLGSLYFEANDLVEGTAIPVENGGDLFALNFHSWDLDQGALDYTGELVDMHHGHSSYLSMFRVCHLTKTLCVPDAEQLERLGCVIARFYIPVRCL